LHQEVNILGRFRVRGLQPEVWRPDTGAIERCAVWRERDGVTEVPLRFGDADSLFVVFRKPARGLSILTVTRDGQTALSAQEVPGPVSKVELTGTADGQVEAVFHVGGRYQLHNASGPVAALSVEELPAPVEIGGPWEVRFDPKWMGPAVGGRRSEAGKDGTVVFEKLTDWSIHADARIKYFSGTAVYRKEFDLPSSVLSPGSSIVLDLGRVQVMAEVTLNGRALGTLWKPPFRVDITEAAKPGDNVLEIRVVNLWPNRLIGDEQLPDDCVWDTPSIHGGRPLKAWPSWLLEGKPSPTGRRTFSSWKFYEKDSPLLESGLLGPVRLLSSERRTFAGSTSAGGAAKHED
jgi:hypothetical protein